MMAGERVRCTGVNVRGGRCGRVAKIGSEPALCVFHSRENKYKAPRKVRCVARRVDGRQCRGWALRVDDGRPIHGQGTADDGGGPFCSVHAGRSVAQMAPPDEARCVAVGRNGERCKGWALRADDGRLTLDDGRPIHGQGMGDDGGDGRLCSVHAGVSGWRGGECPVAWPLADEVRCVAARVDGGRCRARAVVDGLCVNHAGLTGFEEGNEVAWKHGLYARPTPVEEAARFTFMMARVELSVHGITEPGSEDWWRMLRMCRLMVSLLFDNWNKGVVYKGWGVMARHGRLILQGVDVIRRLVMKGNSEGAGKQRRVDRAFEEWVAGLPDEFWEKIR